MILRVVQTVSIKPKIHFFYLFWFLTEKETDDFAVELWPIFQMPLARSGILILRCLRRP